MATTTTDIVERQFWAATALLPADLEPALRAVCPGLQTIAAAQRRDAYLDSEDWWFHTAGAALRATFRDGRGSLALELLAPCELAFPNLHPTREALPAAPPALAGSLPGSEIAAWLAPLMGGRTVSEKLVLAGQERSCRIPTRQGAAVEVGLSALQVAGSPGAAGVLVVEVRAPVEAGAETDRFVKSLASAVAIEIAEGPAFPQALLAAGIAMPALTEGRDLILQPADRVVDAAHRVLRRHFGRLLWNEPGARLGLDPERLHDMRVSARRMRSSLRAFQDALSPRRHDSLRRDLQWVAQALGAVRDLEVHMAHLRQESGRLGAEAQAGVSWYLDHLATRRERARKALLQKLDTRKYAAFVDRCRRFLDDGPPARPAHPAARAPATAAACRIIRGNLDKVLRGGREIGPDSPDADLHRLRIQCKRLRYACEFFADYFGPCAVRFAARVTRLQDILGAHQDAVVARLELMGFASRAGGSRSRLRELCLALGQLVQYYSERARRTRAEFARAWQRFDRKKVRKTLMRRMRALERASA